MTAAAQADRAESNNTKPGVLSRITRVTLMRSGFRWQPVRLGGKSIRVGVLHN